MIPAVMISGRTPARGAVKPVLLKGLSAIQMHLAKLQARGANLAYVYFQYDQWRLSILIKWRVTFLTGQQPRRLWNCRRLIRKKTGHREGFYTGACLPRCT